MSAAPLIGIIIVALAIVSVIVWYAVARRHQTQLLHAQYGREYDRTVAHASSRRAAEAELVKRQERVEHFDIRPLTAEQRDLFSQQWHEVQEMFVDSPGRAVTNADTLVAEVMQVRGYPVAEFEQRVTRVVDRELPLPSDQTLGTADERVQRQPIAPPRSDRAAR